jgi:hypothetical protein
MGARAGAGDGADEAGEREDRQHGERCRMAER